MSAEFEERFAQSWEEVSYSEHDYMNLSEKVEITLKHVHVILNAELDRGM